MAKTTRVGNEKYLGGFWIIEAADLDVTLKLAADGFDGRIVHDRLTRKS